MSIGAIPIGWPECKSCGSFNHPSARVCTKCGNVITQKDDQSLERVPIYDHPTRTQIPNAKPERNKAPALEQPVPREETGVGRITLRFTGRRVRPLDPDNFAGSVKDTIDGLRAAGLIHGDEPWRIRLETEQERVGSFAEEETILEIVYPNGPPTE